MAYNNTREYKFRGQLCSLEDRCVNCGMVLGEHSGSDGAYCPKNNLKRWHEPDYWTARGTTFQFRPAKLMVPDGV